VGRARISAGWRHSPSFQQSCDLVLIHFLSLSLATENRWSCLHVSIFFSMLACHNLSLFIPVRQLVCGLVPRDLSHSSVWYSTARVQFCAYMYYIESQIGHR
jgi:hypothetical protein